MTNDKCHGFTLLELIVVVAIMGFFLAMVPRLFTRHSDQTRFDQTVERMSEIKRAILGSHSDHIRENKQFAGYVQDMGGLPHLYNGQPEGLWTDDPDNDGNKLPGWHIEGYDHGEGGGGARGLRYWQFMGWRGPYIEEPTDSALRDGWGNPFIFEVDEGNMTIKSTGANGLEDDKDTGYDEDIILTIKKSEYMAPVAGQVVGFEQKDRVRVRIHFPWLHEEEGDWKIDSKKTVDGVNEDGYFYFDFVEGDSDGTGRASLDIPVGRRYIVAWEENDPGDAEEDAPDSEYGDTGNNEIQKKMMTYITPAGNWLGIFPLRKDHSGED